MITIDRKIEMYDSWLAETDDFESEEWRDDLNEAEAALVDAWDESFERGCFRVCKDILDKQKEVSA